MARLIRRARAVYLERARAAKAPARDLRYALLHEYLLEHPCIDCGESDPVVLDFDHRPGETKLFAVTHGARRGHSVDRLIAEIAKCDVRCANCHRRATYRRAGLSHRG